MGRYYKYVRDDYSAFTQLDEEEIPYPFQPVYTVGAAIVHPSPDEDKTKICAPGLHACHRRYDGIQFRGCTDGLKVRLLEVEIADEDIIASDELKVRCRKLTVVAEHADTLGPQTEAVKAFLRELPKYPWLKPQTQDVMWMSHHTEEAVKAAREYGPVECKGVKFVTRDAARAAARDAAGYAAWDAAWDAARAAAWDAARAAARDAAGYAARDAAGYAAWDAAGAAAYLSVSDLMSKPDMFAPLCALWKLGCWPVGVCDGWFVLWAGDKLVGKTVEWKGDAQ